MYFLPTFLMRNIKKQNKTNFTNPPIANTIASLPQTAVIHLVFIVCKVLYMHYLNPHEAGTIVIPFCRKGNGLTQLAHGRCGRLPPPAVLCLSPSPHRLGSLPLHLCSAPGAAISLKPGVCSVLLPWVMKYTHIACKKHSN